MTSEGLGEMFEGDSADTCAGKFPLLSMGGRAEGLACADPGARTPISASRNSYTRQIINQPTDQISECLYCSCYKAFKYLPFILCLCIQGLDFID